MVFFRTFSALLICSASIGSARAGDRLEPLATPYFSHIGRENGLPHDIVMDFAQDATGFVWIATQGGLARWDGYRLRVFTHVEGDPTSLPDSTVVRLLAGERGQLWAASSSGIVARFDPATERFQVLPHAPGLIGFPNGMIEDGAGGLWAGGSDGLAHFTGGLWQADPGIQGDVDGAVHCLLRTADGALWVCGTTRLWRRAPGAQDLVPQPVLAGAGAISALLADPAGRIWFGTQTAAVGLLDPVSGAPRLLVPPDPAAGSIRMMAPDLPGEIWVPTNDARILVVDAVKGLRDQIVAHSGLPSALAVDFLYAVMRDRSGMMWVGGLGGAAMHPPDPPTVDTIWPTLDPAHGPWDADVLGLCRDTGADRLWFATRREGLLVVGDQPGTPVAFRPALPQAVPGTVTFGCALAPDGTLIVALRQGLITLGPHATALPPPIDPEVVAKFLLIDGPDLWMAGDTGVWRADLQGHIEQHWSFSATDPESLSNTRVETLLVAPNGDVWIGTHGGLDRLDRKTGKIERILPSAEAGSLPGTTVSSLLLDRRGRLWVGTIGGAGIGLLEDPAAPGPRRFRRIGLAEGLPSVNIGALLEDDAGRIWASSTEGLIVIDPDSLQPRGLAAADGVAIRSYWVHSGMKLPDGTLLFGGLKGASRVHPDRLTDWTFRPAVVATAIRIGSRSLPSGGPIVIHPNDPGLQVEFSALDYSAPELNRYAYRLQGHDADWIETDAEHRLAAYTNLAPGRYTLLLRGSNRVGAWTDPPTALPVVVLPAWYQTWWFLIVESLVGLLLFLGIIRLRTYRLERNRRALEREVARRTEELERSQAALERSNATLAASADTLRRLGEIGRVITGSLDGAEVFAALCRNIGSILDADSIAIWLIDEPLRRLVLAYGIEHGRELPSRTVSLDDPMDHVAGAARARCEIVIESGLADPGLGASATALFGPLWVKDRLFGILTVQTHQARAYGERERLAFATLCAYGATGLANAQAHRELARVIGELGRLASYDLLTGLANRRHFFEVAEREIARAPRHGRAVSLILADLDRFKTINDTYGHAAGDVALAATARCLEESVRRSDLTARYGGEEFIALMLETTLQGAVEVARRFADALANRPIDYHGVRLSVTVSVGVATWRPAEETIERAIERADLALYRVKNAGRNGVAAEDLAG